MTYVHLISENSQERGNNDMDAQIANARPLGNEIIEVRFVDGSLAGREPRQMSGIGEHLIAWEHLQAKGVIQISSPDSPERQANLWKRHDYLL